MNYQDYASQYGGAIEAIGGQLYDTVVFTGGATLNLVFFTALRNNLALSNMELAGTLPSPKGFLIRSIRVAIKEEPLSTARAAAGAVQPGALDNVAQIINTGVFTLTIGAKQYAQFPLWLLPAGMGLDGPMASDGDVADPGEIQDYGCNGVPDIRNVRTLSKPIFIGPQINFNGTIVWPAPVIALAGPGAPHTIPITVILDGDLLRPVQ